MAGDRTTPGAPTVAVVIAVKNGMPFIADTVRSALAEGDAVERVIVVDDGSDDGTRESIEAIADPRVSVIDNPGRGVSSARNAGAALATSRWLLFLDADDCLVSSGVTRLLAAAALQPDAVAVYGDYERIDAQGRRTGKRFLIRSRRKPSGDILARLVCGNFIVNGGIVIVARDIYTRLGGFDPTLSLCEDWHLWCRLAAQGTFLYTPDLVMNYRVHSTSVMMRRLRRFDDFKPALDAIYRDEQVLSAISPDVIRTARREAEVSLMTYCAAQACRNGAIVSGIGMALEAIGHHPAKAPSVMLRLGGAIAGL